MITSFEPESWRQLQDAVARILNEAGLTAGVEVKMGLARGQVVIDVSAEEIVYGRSRRVLVECKHWKRDIPQSVVHGFRTVVADAGANIGYIVASSKFQPGAVQAAESSNVRLVTWAEFQDEFEPAWLMNYFARTIDERLSSLMSLTEPWMPPRGLKAEDSRAYGKLLDRYEPLSALMLSLGPYIRSLVWSPFPTLPLRGTPSLPEVGSLAGVPEELLDIASYREFLERAIEIGEEGVARFREILSRRDVQATVD